MPVVPFGYFFAFVRAREENNEGWDDKSDTLDHIGWNIRIIYIRHAKWLLSSRDFHGCDGDHGRSGRGLREKNDRDGYDHASHRHLSYCYFTFRFLFFILSDRGCIFCRFHGYARAYDRVYDHANGHVCDHVPRVYGHALHDHACSYFHVRVQS